MKPNDLTCFWPNTRLSGLPLLKCRWKLNFNIFQVISSFRGEFQGSQSDNSRKICIDLLEGSTDKSAVLPFSTISCSGNTPAAVTVVSISNTEVGNKCNDNIILVKSVGKCGKCLKWISCTYINYFVWHVPFLLLCKFYIYLTCICICNLFLTPIRHCAFQLMYKTQNQWPLFFSHWGESSRELFWIPVVRCLSIRPSVRLSVCL